MSEGWICLHRKMLKWEWYDDTNTFRLFIHCLLKANYEDKKWHGQIIKRGSFITSYPKLALETGLTVRQVRTSIDKLKLTGELTHSSTAKYSMISIKNYNQYQDYDRQVDSQATGKRQASDRQMTTTKQYNNINKENNIESTKELYVSLSNKEEKNGKIEREKNNFLSKEDKRILRNFAKKHQVNNVQAYIKTLINNGDYIEILKEEKEKQRKQPKKENPKESIPPPEISKEEDEKIKQIQRQVREKIRRLK